MMEAFNVPLIDGSWGKFINGGWGKFIDSGRGISTVSSYPDSGTQDPPIAHSQITCARLTTVYMIHVIGQIQYL